jgi:hypothetical protein
MRKMIELNVMDGKTPSTRAGVAVYVTMQHLNLGITCGQVAKACSVKKTQSTIKSNFVEIKPYLSQVVVALPRVIGSSKLRPEFTSQLDISSSDAQEL